MIQTDWQVRIAHLLHGWMSVEAIAGQILASKDEGLTLSGGEPFEQAGALAELCVRLRAARPWSFMAYTGLRWEEFRERDDVQRLLGQLDVLIDGPFIRAQRADLRWRASRNQRILLLSARHADDPWRSEPDRSAGIEVHVSPEGQVFWAGVPPTGGALSGLRRRLVRHGVRLHPTQEVWS
jgi:anaerobic ribonucleoside-triphosphate reductase activating protein